MIICSYNVVSDHEVRTAIATGAPPRTTGDLFRCLGCSAQCGRCARSIKRIMDEPPIEHPRGHLEGLHTWSVAHRAGQRHIAAQKPLMQIKSAERAGPSAVVCKNSTGRRWVPTAQSGHVDRSDGGTRFRGGLPRCSMWSLSWSPMLAANGFPRTSSCPGTQRGTTEINRDRPPTPSKRAMG
jgi:bacterioferritin-associated ferredoxin